MHAPLLSKRDKLFPERMILNTLLAYLTIRLVQSKNDVRKPYTKD